MKTGHKLITLMSGGGVRYETPSYANQYGSGDRSISLLGKVSTSGGALWSVIDPLLGALINGNTSDNGGYLGDGIAVANSYLLVDFTTPRLVTEIKIRFNTAGAASGVWRPVGWNGTTFTAIGPDFTLGTGLSSLVQTIDASGNTTGYRGAGIQGVSGNSSFNLYYWSEVEFKIAAPL